MPRRPSLSSAAWSTAFSAVRGCAPTSAPLFAGEISTSSAARSVSTRTRPTTPAIGTSTRHAGGAPGMERTREDDDRAGGLRLRRGRRSRERRTPRAPAPDGPAARWRHALRALREECEPPPHQSARPEVDIHHGFPRERPDRDMGRRPNRPHQLPDDQRLPAEGPHVVGDGAGAPSRATRSSPGTPGCPFERHCPIIAPRNDEHGWRNGRRSGFRFHRREA